MEALVAGERVTAFGVAVEGQGDGPAAPFLAAVPVAGDLFGGAALFVCFAFSRADGSREFAEIDHGLGVLLILRRMGAGSVSAGEKMRRGPR